MRVRAIGHIHRPRAMKSLQSGSGQRRTHRDAHLVQLCFG